jgi:hypothetical protein
VTTSTRARRRLFSSAGTAAVLAALAAVNVLSGFAHTRLDLSSDQSASLSPGTKAALGRLKDPLIVEVFFTAHLPPPFSLSERYLRDLLDEYRAAGRGRVTLRWTDPDRDPSAARRAHEAGIEPVQVNTAGRGRFEAKEAFMGVALISGARGQSLAVVEDPADLEYQLTRRVKMLAGDKPRVVGFAAGHGAHVPGDRGLEELFARAAEVVEARVVALDAPLPAGLDALWLAGPTSRLKPAELDALAAFAASGKTVVVLQNSRQVDFVEFKSAAVDAGLAPLLSRWGLSLGSGLVADAQGERAQLQVPFGGRAGVQVVDYAFVPVSTRLNTAHPATAGLGAVPFPFVSPVVFDAAKASGARFETLAWSSQESRMVDAADVSPRRSYGELPGGAAGPFALAGVAAGPAGRLVVIGTPYLLDARIAGQPPVQAFLVNLMEWSAQDPAFLSQHGKGLVYRPLAPLPDRARSLVRWLLALALPAGTLAGAAALHAERRRRLRELPALYADA